MCARRHVAALLYNSIQTFKDQLLKNNGRVSCWPKKKTRRTLLVWEEAGMAPGPRSRTNRLANCRLPLLSFVSHSELGLFFLLQCCLDYNKKLWSFWFNCTIIIIGTTFLPISPVCKSEILWLAPLVFARPQGTALAPLIWQQLLKTNSERQNSWEPHVKQTRGGAWPVSLPETPWWRMERSTVSANTNIGRSLHNPDMGLATRSPDATPPSLGEKPVGFLG